MFIFNANTARQDVKENLFYRIESNISGLEVFDSQGWLDKETEELFSDPDYYDTTHFEIHEEERLAGMRKSYPPDYFNQLVKKIERIKANYDLSEEVMEYKQEDYEGLSLLQRRVLDRIYPCQAFIDNELAQDEKGNYGFDMTQAVVSANGISILLAIVVSLIFTSMDHLTSYYQFSRMYPWKEEMTWLSKFIIGLVLVVGVHLVFALVKYGIYVNSIYGSVIVFRDFWIQLVKEVLILMSFYSMMMATGALAGNFIGHLGTALVAFLGLDLWTSNISALAQIFTGYSSNPGERLYQALDGINQLPILVQGILRPNYVLTNYYDVSAGLLLSLALLFILFLVLGIIWTRRAKAERSQMCILARPESIYIKFCAVVTTAIIISSIASVMGLFKLASIIILALSLVLCYKFYDFLFRARIGFQA